MEPTVEPRQQSRQGVIEQRDTPQSRVGGTSAGSELN